MSISSLSPQQLMELALAQARCAQAQGEVPVGAVLVVGDEVVASTHNLVERLSDATAHAELLAIQAASRKLSRWRLDDASLYVTLEPCVMCIGAILLARIRHLHFGSYDPVQGAAGSLFNLAAHPTLPRSVEVYPELLAEESSALLRCFFEERRGHGK